ncbi:MAG: leucyl aminopeptidase [candidate division WOR-3 bacterium]|nr:MAG: leucyl aminopeptidase [candidate division WOR-3 bacterium]
MKIDVVAQAIADFPGDAVVLSLYEDGRTLTAPAAAIDRRTGKLISKLVKDHEITGKLGETTVLHGCNGVKARKIIVVGTGERKDFGYETIRKAAAAAAKKARQINARNVGTIIPGLDQGDIDPARAVQSIVEGTCLALYRFSGYKKPEKTSEISSLSILVQGKANIGNLKRAAGLGKNLADAQNTARDLINEPSNRLTPERLYRRIESVIKDWGLVKVIKCRSLNRNAIRKSGMEAISTVAQGSAHEERFIILRYRTADKPLVGLIGKTVTFDSGGISIKSASGMAAMKGDMAGGAIAFAATLALARAGCRMNLITLIPAVENMPSGSAYRPGDIIRAMSGKTIEIITTDAEGRLTLADAITYAEKKGAESIIDIATLTGGCVVALGTQIAALMTNEQELVDKLINRSHYTGEKFWQLPLPEEYQKQLKSDVADLKNAGGRNASTITAGLFLKAFVNKAKWLHIDVAGKELTEIENNYTPVGATGFGVRSLYELLSDM